MEQKTTKRPITPWMIKRLHILYAKHKLNQEEYRGMIVELTDGRTDTTKELTYAEAQYLAGYITGANTKLQTTAEQMAVQAIKKQRSAVLKRLQQIGINTASWDAVNSYLKSPRIAEKPLYELDSDELAALIPKLESIKRKQNEET